MHLKLISFYIGFFILLASCKKEDNDPVSTNDNSNGDTATVDTTENQVKGETVVVIKTEFGKSLMWLYKRTPKHRDNFIQLARDGFFDGTTFHRIIDGFVIQGGDPNSKDDDPSNDGSGGPGYTIEAEISDSLNHIEGAVGAARQPNSSNPERRSSGSQFYIVENSSGTPNLNGEYTVFGYVFDGMDMVRTIAEQSKNDDDRPKTDIEMDVNLRKIELKTLKDSFNFAPPTF